jgi:hypothetical protein
MPRAPSLRSLFLAWVCFSLAFCTIVQTFLTTFLIDSGYETPIQSMDELFASGITLAHMQGHDYIFQNNDENGAMEVHRNHVECPSENICFNWALYQKNVSILLSDIFVELHYAYGDFVGENSEPLVCRLEDGVVFNTGLTMIMLYGDPLMRRVNEIINRVVEAGLYNYWISVIMNNYKIKSHKIVIVHPLDRYYSFKLYHMQIAFYLLFMGWCISVFCFVIEVLCNRVLSKRN